MLDVDDWIDRLEADGLVLRSADGMTLTNRWHAALARASLAQFREGTDLTDMRAPVARALVDLYADEEAESLAIAVGVMVPVVIADLAKIAVLTATVPQ